MKEKKLKCKYCGGKLEAKTTRREFCSNKCKVYWHRELAAKVVQEYSQVFHPTSSANIEKFNEVFKKEFEKQLPKPKNLQELKELCPKEITGFERSEWIASERQKYGI